MADINVSKNGHIGTVELNRPPNNFLDMELIGEVAGAFEEFDRDDNIRAIVLCSAGKHFCAGANLGQRLANEAAGKPAQTGKHLYHEANRLVRTKKPFVAAVQGAAVGAGCGLALVADFRVGCSEARFSTNFARQGYHPGFGTTHTLQRIVGVQKASWLLYTGERIDGDEAFKIGLIDRLVPLDKVRDTALRDGRGDRPLRAARGAGDAHDAAARPRARVCRGHRARILRADLAARHRRLQGRRRRDERKAGAELQGAVRGVARFENHGSSSRTRGQHAPNK